MATLAELRTDVKVNMKRTSTSIDAVIDLAINSAIELIGHNIPGIYDEELWEHTFVTADVTNKVDNFPLPTNTKYIRSANFIDTTTTGQETFYPLLQISPDDAYDTDKIEGYRTGNIGYTTNVRDISATKQWNLNTFQRGGISTIGRSNRSGRPEFVYRIATNIYIHPYITTPYVDWKLRLFLVMYPDKLSATGDTNTISVNFPYALMHFACGIIWSSHFHDQQRAQAEFSLGAQMLSEVARDDQLKKLINMQTRFVA